MLSFITINLRSIKMNNLHKRFSGACLSALLAIVVLLLSSQTLHAQEEDSNSDSEWNYAIAMYLWAAQIEMTAPSGNSADFPFYKILDNLKMTFMGDIAAQKGNWTVAADVMYLDVGGNQTDTESAPPSTIQVGAGTASWIVTPTVGYALIDSDKGRFELVGGARYLYLDAYARTKVDGVQGVDLEASESFWDIVVGVRGRLNLSQKWFVPVYFDVGGGSGTSTWQGFAGVGYRFKHFDSLLTYRYLNYKFDNVPVMSDLTMKGPFAGMVFRF
jgi:hypothetical protein